MARQRSSPAPTGYTLLVIDDNPEYLVAAERLLARCGHSVVAISNPIEALELLRRRTFDLVLVDFFMPEMTGEGLVAELRTFDPHTQVILQTGYASEMPPRELVRRLDIQGYYDKSEGPEKMLLCVDVGLKAARAARALRRERDAQRAVLDAAIAMRLARSPEELRAIVTSRLTSVLEGLVAGRGEADGEAHRAPDFLWSTGPDTARLQIAGAIGRWESAPVSAQLSSTDLSEDAMAGLRRAVSERAVQTGAWGTVVPLVVRGEPVGAMFFAAAEMDPTDVAILRAFADQAAAVLATAL